MSNFWGPLHLNSLDSTSRQYFDQGVKCYEAEEHDLAKERFTRALEANRTNFVAYQYLGFIAVHEDQPQTAIRNFDLARKFAEDSYHRALALSHLARSYKAVGNLALAVQASTAATGAAPGYAKFWHEAAVYHVNLSQAAEAIRCLRRAVMIDKSYWSLIVADATFDPIRDEVLALLDEMRTRLSQMAQDCLGASRRIVRYLERIDVTCTVPEVARKLNRWEEHYKSCPVFAYPDIMREAIGATKTEIKVALGILSQGRSDGEREESKRTCNDSLRQFAQIEERLGASGFVWLKYSHV